MYKFLVTVKGVEIVTQDVRTDDTFFIPASDLNDVIHSEDYRKELLKILKKESVVVEALHENSDNNIPFDLPIIAVEDEEDGGNKKWK